MKKKIQKYEQPTDEQSNNRTAAHSSFERSNVRMFVALIFALCLLAISCKINYSFSGASVSPDIKTVSIGYIKNNSSLGPPTLSQAVTESLKDIFTQQTSLGIIPRDGDLSFEGEITGYLIAPVALQANDVAAMNRLTVTVNIRFNNTKDEKQKFESGFSRYADFPSSTPISNVQDELIRQINEQLSQDIFNKAMINW